jgi:RNA polymerase sigma factor (sigma-70 family)
MEHYSNAPDSSFAQLLDNARPRLVRLCASLSNNPGAAEDLAQETLIEAWRIRYKLTEPAGIDHWLAAIARNVCSRWFRQQSREPVSSPLFAPDSQLHSLAESYDFEIELERSELATLLDRAMVLLPPATRQALIGHYIDELPHAALATHFGISEGAVALRLHRGKLALRRAFANELRAEASAFGLHLFAEEQATWQETRIWCPQCGAHRLKGSFEPMRGLFHVRCPSCSHEPALPICRHDNSPVVFQGVKGFKAAYSRAMAWGHAYYGAALASQQSGMAHCWKCNRLMPLHLTIPTNNATVAVSQRGTRGVYVYCTACNAQSYTSARGLALHLPEGRRFWKNHPRIRMLPEQEIEVGGQLASVIGFESVTCHARFEVVTLKDTFMVIKIATPDRVTSHG